MSDDEEISRVLTGMYRVTLMVRLRHKETDQTLHAATMEETVEGIRSATHELLAHVLARLLDPPA